MWHIHKKGDNSGAEMGQKRGVVSAEECGFRSCKRDYTHTRTHKDTIHSVLTPETSSIQSFQSLLSHTAQRRARTEEKMGRVAYLYKYAFLQSRLDASRTTVNMCLFWRRSTRLLICDGNSERGTQKSYWFLHTPDGF